MDIFQEYPDEVEYIFKPSCVPLMRCAGCCGDEGLECVPVDVYNVTMEVRVQLASSHAWVEVSKSTVTATPSPSSQLTQRKGSYLREQEIVGSGGFTSLLTFMSSVTQCRVKRGVACVSSRLGRESPLTLLVLKHSS